MSKSVGLSVLLLAAILAGCAEDTPQVLGTLEYDRISLPAPSAERIVSVDVREGDTVKAGATLLTLERTRIAAQTDAVGIGERSHFGGSKVWQNGLSGVTAQAFGLIADALKRGAVGVGGGAADCG